jgi:lysophospholipase L1-like esterase
MRLNIAWLPRFGRACVLPSIGRRALLMAVAALPFLSVEARPAIVQLGITGDSLSYGDGSDYGENPNWHTQLENAGLVAIGPTANQAADGAATADLAAQSQPILALVQAQQLDYSVIAMGSNDATSAAINLVLNHTPIPADFSSTVAERVTSTMAALRAADLSHHLHQIVANIPDIIQTPALQSAIITLGVTQQDVNAIRQAVLDANAQIESTARQDGIPVLDLFKLIDEVGSQPLTLAGVTTAVADLYPADGFHPSALLHGLTANMFIDAANRGYGAMLDSLSDQQIVSNASLTPLAAGPTFFDVSPYVIVPEPSSLAIVGSSLLILWRLIGIRPKERLPQRSPNDAQ